MVDLIRKALIELVDLQDMEVAMAKLAAEPDYLESPPKIAAYDCMATGYASRRSAAWKAARTALAASATPAEPTDYKAMFQRAVASLAAISEALAIPDDEAATGEPEIIIDYIRELKRGRDEWAEAGYAVAAEAGQAAQGTPQEPNSWLGIETAPKDGRTLLLGYYNPLGNWRTVRGEWMSAEYIAENWEDPDGAEPGWYETTVESEEIPNCWQIEPTHWMPLPGAPAALTTQGDSRG